MMDRLSRRELLAGAAVAGGAVLLPGTASARPFAIKPMTVPVPDKLPSAVYASEKVGIMKATHDEHLKLWQGYARKVNEILGKLEDGAANANPSQIYSDMRALKANFPFAWGGYINHEIYFNGFGEPVAAMIGSNTQRVIEGSYGSMQAWEADLKATALAARGWVFVGVNPRVGRIFNFLGDAQDTFPAWGHDLVLACDVYEHAYYLDFKTDRKKYVDAWYQCIDWAGLEIRISAALAKV
jgi:Fe-Mn family superoxide dismutase